MSEICYDVCILGGGPAALTAAIYTTRAKLSTILFEGAEDAGGQLTQTTEVENFPGFPEGVMGFDLVWKMREQARHWGTDIRSLQAEKVQHLAQSRLFRVFYRNDKSMATVLAKSVIVATGSTGKRLNFTNSESFWNRGITGCAVCHGGLPLFRNQRLFVVGGGDSAMEDALYLTKFASEVVIVHRRDVFRASKIMQERVFAQPKIKILWNSEVVKVDGDQTLRSVSVLNKLDGTVQVYDAGGMFYAIGHTPNTSTVGHMVQLDEEGYILTDYLTTVTSVPGIFAAGDVRANDKKYKQAIVAAGSGCKASLDVIDYLQAWA